MNRKLLSLFLVLAVSLSATAQSKTEKDFLEFTDGLYDCGQEMLQKAGSRQADWYFGQAAAAVTSWRTAIAQIALDKVKEADKKILEEDIEAAEDVEIEGFDLGGILSGLQSFAKAAEKFNEKLEATTEKMENKLGLVSFRVKDQQWYVARSYGLASPYPDYFRGLVHDWRGEAEAAEKYYGRASANPWFPRSSFDFSYLADLDLQELDALSKRLVRYQSRYESALSEKSFHFDKDVPTWDADALAREAARLLSDGHQDFSQAQDYLEAAARVNPFEAKYVYFCALLSAQLKDAVTTARYLNEALKLDPDNEKLRAAIVVWNSNKEEVL